MDYQFLHNHLHWFHQKYYKVLGTDPFYYGRWTTMKMALNLLHQRTDACNIVETGCQRAEEDWGAGCSTQVFSDYCFNYGGKLTSVDINEENIKLASSVVRHPEVAHFILSDSVEYLHTYNQPIDLLYLDSLDFPLGPILEDYGGKEDLDKALEVIQGLEEDFVVQNYGDLIKESQGHCLTEIKAAWSCLHDNSIILLDDALLPAAGKARLARDFILSQGWSLVMSGYQLLFIK